MGGVIGTMQKPAFTVDQLVSSTQAVKNFGELRRRAKAKPIAITDNGDVDTIIVGYSYFEKMYARLMELEDKEEDRILGERIDRLDKDPQAGIPWRSFKKD